jgi:hypothetical protein
VTSTAVREIDEDTVVRTTFPMTALSRVAEDAVSEKLADEETW